MDSTNLYILVACIVLTYLIYVCLCLSVVPVTNRAHNLIALSQGKEEGSQRKPMKTWGEHTNSMWFSIILISHQVRASPRPNPDPNLSLIQALSWA